MVLSAHPMGNFSVSHYTRIDVRPNGVADVTYILDLAELPTFELLQKWELQPDSPQTQLDAKAAVEARAWVANLKFRLDGKPVAGRVTNTKLVKADGAGALAIIRVTTHIEVPMSGAGGTLEYQDTNYPERAGWKEIVVGAAKGVTLVEASHIDVERSKALTEYPTDPAVAPPQDLRARVEWKTNAPAVVAAPATASAPAKPAIVELAQPKAVAPPAPTIPQQQVGGQPTTAAPGEVVKGDTLSLLMSKRDLGLTTMLFGLAMAFWLGCLHATTPGHGKTMVAAYLVGERGTPKHALILGAVVTFTHTISVFALGVATYFLAGSIAPERVTKFLGILSGLSIVVIGLWLMYKRSMKLVGTAAPAHRHEAHSHHDHDHEPAHEHKHVHAHAETHVHAGHGHSHAPALQLVVPHKHDHGHGHDHPHDHKHHDHDHGHDHGPGGHSHVPEGPITMGSLIALGASGGLVPCPTALVLLLSAISIGRISLGLALLVSFSFGLAAVLMAIGLAVLYAKHLLPKTESTIKHPIVKLIPVLSAGVITVIGIAMTATALGWVKIAGV